MLHQFVYWILLAAMLSYSWLRGGPPEQLAACAWAIASLLSTAAVLLHLGGYETLQFGVFSVDVVLLVFLVCLSLKADRVWPLWITGFHLVGVMTHVAKALESDLHPWAYAVGQAGGGYLIMGTITAGAARHARRTRRNGPERSWRTFSARLAPLKPRSGPPAS